MKGQQLPLAVGLSQQHRFDNFHPGPNFAAIASLRSLLDLEGDQIWLHGGAGSGKTHLLHALRSEAREAGVTALSLDPAADPQWTAAAKVPLLCVEDFDRHHWSDEQALSLLRLIDRRRQQAGTATLLTARLAPHQLAGALPDLRADLLTRLSAFASFGLKPLQDEHRLQLLQLRCNACGLMLPLEVATFLLRHLPRDTASLLAAVATLDHASLAAQRRLTVPFTQQALGL